MDGWLSADRRQMSDVKTFIDTYPPTERLCRCAGAEIGLHSSKYGANVGCLLRQNKVNCVESR